MALQPKEPIQPWICMTPNIPGYDLRIEGTTSVGTCAGDDYGIKMPTVSFFTALNAVAPL